MFFYFMARFSWLYSTLNLAIQHNKFGYIAVGSLAIQPDISGYIARYTWLYSSWLYSQASYSNLRYIASYLWLYSYWLYSQIYLAIQLAGYIARYIWLYSQIYLAIQLLAIQPDIYGYIASSQETPKQPSEPICMLQLIWIISQYRYQLANIYTSQRPS